MEDILGQGFGDKPVFVDVTAPPPPPPYVSKIESIPDKKPRLIPSMNDFNDNIDDVNKSVHDYIWQHHRTFYVGSWVGSSVLCAVFLWLEITYLPGLLGNPTSIDARVYLLPFVTLFWPANMYIYYKSQMQHLFTQQIAQVLTFTYAPKGDPATVASTILKAGHDIKMEDVMVGMYQQNPIRIYNYTSTIGYGRGSHTDSYTVFEIAFDKKLPDIVLQPASAFYVSSDRTIVQLEGDFNKYFNLHAPQGYDMEIRVIFQPDLMADLVDKYRAYSIEIFQNKVYVLAPVLTNKANFLNTHDLMDSLFTKILPSMEEVAAPIASAQSTQI